MLCLGSIGSSGQFCVALKARGLNHCGTVAHARAKFRVMYDSFYTPAGVLLGKASAKRTPSIARADIPRAMLQIFETGMRMSTARWESLFNKAITKGPLTPARAFVACTSSPIDVTLQDQDDMSAGTLPSTISYLEVGMAPPEDDWPPSWGMGAKESFTSSDWPLVARKHRSALEHLGAMVSSIASTVPAVVHKLNLKL
jgi:hypothetical protein